VTDCRHLGFSSSAMYLWGRPYTG